MVFLGSGDPVNTVVAVSTPVRQINRRHASEKFGETALDDKT
jgi:hypothetical protein